MHAQDEQAPAGCRRTRRAAAVAAAVLVGLGATSASASAAVTITPTTDAALVARSILDNPDATFAGAAFVTQPLADIDPPPVDPGDPTQEPAKTAAIVMGDATTPLYSGFPLSGPDFALLTSGDPLNTTEPQESQSDIEWSDPDDIAATRGSSVHDLTTLRIDFNVPPEANCLALSYRFLSEEFPEFVGSQYNDAFIAELDASNWTTDPENNLVVPNDFATKAGGKPVSVNGVGPTAVAPAEATGTIFDAATGLVTTKTPITPGAHSVFLSIFDQSDHIYDSTVMLDRLSFGAEDPSTCQPPKVAETPPPPAPPVTSPPPPPPPPAPSNAFEVTGGSITFKNGSATLTIDVPGPGTLTATDASAAASARATAARKKKALVKPAKAVATKAGPVKLKIKPTKKGKRILRKKHKLKVKLAITFTPTGGTPNKQVKKITIKLKKKSKR